MTTEKISETTLLDILREKQAKEKMTDRAFARKMGVDDSLWSLTLSGKKRVHLTLLRAIVRTFPDLRPKVIAFLRNGDV